MDDQEQQAATTTPSDTGLERSVVGLLKARDVTLVQSAVGLVAADGNLSVTMGGCGPVLTNGDVTIRYGGCGPMIVGGDVSIEYGGTQAIVAVGNATIGPKGFVGFVVSPKVSVAEGGKVFMSSRQALALGAGIGVAWAVLSRVIRR